MGKQRKEKRGRTQEVRREEEEEEEEEWREAGRQRRVGERLFCASWGGGEGDGAGGEGGPERRGEPGRPFPLA